MGACWDCSQQGGREYGLLWEIIKTPAPSPSPPPSSLIHKSIFVHFMLFWTHLLKPELMCCSRFLLCFCSVVLIPVRKLSSLQPRVHLWCALRKKCDSLHKKQLKSASFCSAEWPCMVFVFRLYVASLKCRTMVNIYIYSVLFCPSSSINSFVYEWAFLN